MRNILFVIAVIGVWVASKIKLSEPPTIVYTEIEWNNPYLEVIEHERELKEVSLFNDGIEIDYFIAFSDDEVENYMRENYGVSVSWL